MTRAPSNRFGPGLFPSVDSGNLVASLWTLQQGCLDLLQRPLLEKQLAEGLADHLRILVDGHAFPQKRFRTFLEQTSKKSWLQRLLAPSEEGLLESDLETKNPKYESDVHWFATESLSRVRNLRKAVQVYVPWMLPEFVPLWKDATLNFKFDSQSMTIQRLPEVVDQLAARLQFALDHANGSGERKALYQRLQAMLPDARSRALALIEDLKRDRGHSRKVRRRDGLPLPARSAAQVAVARFRSGVGKASHPPVTICWLRRRASPYSPRSPRKIFRRTCGFCWAGRTPANTDFPILLSWTGTMFEYLMPVLWMRTYPNTLLDNSRIAAVRLQQIYADEKSVPWGISESAYAKRDDAGNYQYQAFGLPDISLHQGEPDCLVISPYSTFLALHVDPAAALAQSAPDGRRGMAGPVRVLRVGRLTPLPAAAPGAIAMNWCAAGWPTTRA